MVRRAPQRYPGFATDALSIIFHNCPHTIDSIAEAEQIVIRLMNMSGSRITQGLLNKAQGMAAQIYAITNEYADINMSVQARTWNLVSLHPDVIKGVCRTQNTINSIEIHMLIFCKKSFNPGYPLQEAQGLTTHPLEGRFRTPLSHTDLATMHVHDGKDRFLIYDIKNSCRNYFQSMTDQTLMGEESLQGPDSFAQAESIFGRDVLFSQCPPIRPVPMISGMAKDPFYAWLRDQELFKIWINPHIMGTQVLHLSGDTENLAIFSERSFLGLQHDQAAEDWKQSIFYFRFRRNDCRLNSSRAMMLGFLAQLVSRLAHVAESAVASLLGFIRREHALCFTDLVQFFHELRARKNTKEFCWVISCMEECIDDGMEQVLHNIREIASWSELRFRVLVSGNLPSTIEKSLESFPTIDTRQFPGISLYNKEAEARIASNWGRVRDISTTSFSEAIQDLPKRLGDDYQLNHMVLEWLYSRLQEGSDVDQRDTLTVLTHCSGSGPVEVFEILGEQVSPELRNLRDKAISIVRNARRPLTFLELATALSLDEMDEEVEAGQAYYTAVRHTTRSLEMICPGQFIIQNNEVHFAHKMLGQALPEPMSFEIHADIARRCLTYMALPTSLAEMQDMVEALHGADVALSPSRDTWTAYALSHFADHFLLSGDAKPMKEATTFFANLSTARAWSEARHAISHPLSRMQCGYLCKLPILARTGLYDLVAEYVDRNMSSEHVDPTDYEAECSLAAMEAARHGNTDIVHLLLFKFKPTPAAMRAIISAAVAYGGHELIAYLIEQAGKMKDFGAWTEIEQWSDDVLFRVAWLGHTNIVQSLIHLQVNVNPRQEHVQPQGPPMYASIRGRHKAVTKLLLEAGACTEVETMSEPRTALLEAARWSDPETMKLFLRGRVNITPENYYGKALKVACQFGAFRVVETLLKLGSSPDKGSKYCNNIGYALLLSAQLGFQECVRVLLENKANPNAEDPEDLGRTALQQAVFSNHAAIARLLLIGGAKPNHTKTSVSLPLHDAVNEERLEIVELLLEYGADIEKEDQSRFTPHSTALALAAGATTDAIFQFLITRGADVNHVGKGSRHPLFAACWYDRPNIVEELIRAGADINTPVADPDRSGWRPIHAAYDSAPVLTLLLKAGVEVNQPTHSDGTVLYLASKWNCADSVDILLNHEGKERVDIDRPLVLEDDTDLDGTTPLCVACMRGHVDIIRKLLEAGADINHRTQSGKFPLILCINPEFAVDDKTLEDGVRTIMEYGPRIEIDQRDNDGNTCIHVSRSSIPVSVVRRLVNMGANLAIQNHDGYTPLSKAVQFGNYEIVEYLVSKGADVRPGSSEAPSPLRMACSSGNVRIARLLVEAGADVNELDQRSGESILQACMMAPHGVVDLVEYLVQEQEADVNRGGGLLRYPIISFMHGRFSWPGNDSDPGRVFELLVRNGADLTVEDAAGRRLIHHTFAQYPYLGRQIIELGGDIGITDKLGRTALHYAVGQGVFARTSTKMLLSTHRFDVNAPDIDGWTPLMWACRNQGWPLASTVLLDAGADPWARGKAFYEDWSPAKNVRYFTSLFWSPPYDHLERLEPKSRETKDGTPEVWDESFHVTQRGWTGAEIQNCFGCFNVSACIEPRP